MISPEIITFWKKCFKLKLVIIISCIQKIQALLQIKIGEVNGIADNIF